jgi:hypothetical protein
MPKTRLFFADDNDTTGSHGNQAVTEFDVYQEAIDYAKSAVMNGASNDIYVSVYSYDNTSYQIFRSGNNYVANEITFPYVNP